MQEMLSQCEIYFISHLNRQYHFLHSLPNIFELEDLLISLSFRSLTTVENNLECIKEVNQKAKRGYKHVPHREKSVQVVEKRNARERKRVQEVNQAFLKLQKALPTLNKVME